MSTITDSLGSADSPESAAERAAGDRYVARMDEVDAMPGAAEARQRSYELLGLAAGASVLDVGCGPGRAVGELAALGLRAIGVDLNTRIVEVAAERHPAGEFHVGDVFQLPLPDGAVDGYRADKLYHLIEDQPAALAEARRVLAPGGRIVLACPEWSTVGIDATDTDLTHRIVYGRAKEFPDHGFTTRARAALLDAGFEDVAVEVRTEVITGPAALPLISTLVRIAANHDVVTRDEAATWLADQEERAARGRALLSLPVWFASGTRG